MTDLVDLLITNGDVYTADRSNPRFKTGAVAIKEGRIVAVGSEGDILKRYTTSKKIDARGGMVHPGMIDTHLHLTSVAIHGIPIDVYGRDKSLPNYAQIKCETDDEITHAFTSASAISLMRRGYTCFMEAGTVFETDAFVDSLTKIGMRGLVSTPFGWDDISCVSEHAPGTLNETLLSKVPADTKRVIDGLTSELARNQNADALVKAYVCIYGEATGTNELIQESYNLAREHDVLFNQHQGFIPLWANAEKKHFGDYGVIRLEKLGALTSHTTLNHMNILTEAEAELVLARRPGIVWCPNNAIHQALHPANKCYLPSFYKDGIEISLGVDTTMYHPLGTAGLVALLLSASVGERLEDADPFFMQTFNAANNIGMGDELGTLEAGKRADVVVRGVRDFTQVPLDDHGTLLGMDTASIPVETVVVDGKIVMEDGTMTLVDENLVLSKAVEQRQRLFKKALA